MKARGHLSAASPLYDTTVWTDITQGAYTRALEVLMQHYHAAILRYCASHLQDQEAAQEVTQEVFLAAFEGLPRLYRPTGFKAWLYSIAWHKCLERRRNQRRRTTLRQHYQALIGQCVHCDPPSPPDELCSREHQRRLVWQALGRLRVYERELLVLRYLEGLLQDEIARTLKVSRKTVERHLPRAMARFGNAYARCQPREEKS